MHKCAFSAVDPRSAMGATLSLNKKTVWEDEDKPFLKKCSNSYTNNLY